MHRLECSGRQNGLDSASQLLQAWPGCGCRVVLCRFQAPTHRAPSGRAGYGMCRYNDPTTERASHNVATGHSTGSAPLAGSSVFEGGRRSPEQRGSSPPINHSSDRAVRATLGRQRRPRRPVGRSQPRHASIRLAPRGPTAVWLPSERSGSTPAGMLGPPAWPGFSFLTSSSTDGDAFPCRLLPRSRSATRWRRRYTAIVHASIAICLSTEWLITCFTSVSCYDRST
jgi:hypothetical protein